MQKTSYFLTLALVALGSGLSTTVLALTGQVGFTNSNGDFIASDTLLDFLQYQKDTTLIIGCVVIFLLVLIYLKLWLKR